MKGLFITFEGNEGCGKSTQIKLLSERLKAGGREVVLLREPGGTPVGEEIRHLLKHSDANRDMTNEAELLLMNASRAQMVMEIIRPALEADKIVLCDRFYDSTVAYQGHARGIPMHHVRSIIDYAVGDLCPELTMLLEVSQEISRERKEARQAKEQDPKRDRFEEAGQNFFEKVDEGYRVIAADEPERIKVINAEGTQVEVSKVIWAYVRPLLEQVTGDVPMAELKESGL